MQSDVVEVRAHHKSAVVHPYGMISGGVVKARGVGWRNDVRFIMKNPALAVTYATH
jgi:hypothetical protein